MVLIQDILLAAPGVFAFLAIPQTFKHLLLVASLRDTGEAFLPAVLMQWNGNATPSYTGARIQGGTTFLANADSVALTSFFIGICPGALAPAGFGALELLIPDYTVAANHMWKAHAGAAALLADVQVENDIGSGRFAVAAAVTQVNINPAVGLTFATGSRVSLYGLR